MAVLSVREAQENILGHVKPVEEKEELPLAGLLDRIIAKDLVSPVNVPPQANSAMDGYAIATNHVKSVPCVLPIAHTVAAGSTGQALQSRAAVRIFTGAEIPEGCDAVVMQENTQVTDDGHVAILQLAQKGDNIRPQGQDIAKGTIVIERGTQLLPQHIGVMASMGFATREVFRRPRIALLSTGSELRTPGEALKPGQIYNSNLFMLQCMLQRMACHVDTVETVKDSLQDTTDVLKKYAHSHDVVISTGGVSVGDEDHVKPAVESIGQLHMWKVKMKPGKPLAFGQLSESCLFMGLPGNPVSAFVTFLLFACPLLKKLKGSGKFFSPMDKAPLQFAIDKKRSRPEFLRVRKNSEGLVRFENQSSGVLRSTIWADTLAFIPEDRLLQKGDLVDCIDIEKFYRS